jgi:hypothetical protein
MVLGVFLDLKKAFDTVNHAILLKKLYKYGIRGAAQEWLKNYLSNRYQFVSFDNVESQRKLIKCGVPQGSILGPLLFLLYINDLPSCSDKVLPIIFADDTNVFLKGRGADAIIEIMNTELNNIYKWINANKLSLNISKTQYMVFHTQRNKQVISKELCVNTSAIEYVKHSKFLGVYLDSCLTWDKHISSIRAKTARGMAVISKARPHFNVPTLITLYYSFIYPHLHYCIEVWGKAADTHMSTLYKLQKRVIKKIKSAPFRAESDPIFKELGILKLNDIVQYKVITFMFKFIKGMLPTVFNTMFVRNSTVVQRLTRQQYKLKIPRCHTSALQKTMRYIGVQEWNSICDSIDHACSVHTFKKRAKVYILSKDMH